ncbi:MAG: DUF302 domain-containing protein [Candidatus Thorarchaeota archaeon]|nr:MAG: hypothetical protein DRP09_11895 [Candidatus Thorarchaeota archaeon]RLI59874.1 MAG: hypothetical protein DRO87_01615 [Candidatus Thorarchaeota archaeon]
MVEVLRKEAKVGFDEAVKRVEDACVREGFGVLLTKAVDEILRQKLGVEYPRYTFVLACAPELAKMGLDVSKDVETVFPCSFVVYEDGEKTMVHTHQS